MDEKLEEEIKEIVYYMKNMSGGARKEIALYVRGVYDGSQISKIRSCESEESSRRENAV